MINSALFQRKRLHSKIAGGFFSLEEEGTHLRLHGFGHGEHILLRDESGNIWRGSAERGADDTVRYTFRDAGGRTITGVSDTFGITLRDERGKNWRGFLD